MDEIDAMFSDLLGEMDHLSQVSFFFFFEVESTNLVCLNANVQTS